MSLLPAPSHNLAPTSHIQRQSREAMEEKIGLRESLRLKK